MSGDINKDEQLSRLLEEIKQKREKPDALSFATLEQELRLGKTADTAAQASDTTDGINTEKDATGEVFKIGHDVPLPVKREREKREAQRRSAFSKRHILGALNAGNEEESFDDPINKNMLAPTIERGIDIEYATEEIRAVEEDDTPDALDKIEYAQKHPLFKHATPPKPAVAKPAPTVLPAVPTVFKDPSRTVQNNDLSYTKVLNVKENLDDNFREFFGDTAAGERQAPGEKSQGQRKAKDFILSANYDEEHGVVFEDDYIDFEDEESVNQHADREPEPELTVLMSKRAKAAFRMAVTAVFAVVMAALSVMAQLKMVPNIIAEPLVYYATNMGLLILIVAFNFKQVFVGFARLISFRANGESICSFAAIMALAECALKSDEISALYGSVVALSLCFAAVGSFIDASRILAGFRTVSNNADICATSVADDQKFARRITRDIEIDSVRVMLRRKTEVADNFLKHSCSENVYGKKVFVVSSIALFITLLCGGFTYYSTKSIADTAGVMCGVAALCAPFAATIVSALPISKMQKKLSKVGATVPGYSAAADICSANCVVLEGRELFPKGNVMLHGIKTFERERIDTAILYAASVIIQSCDTMAHMFMDVIQNKTEMLYEVEGVEYEAGLGFSFWAEKQRVMLGTRELMYAHDVEVPSRDYENRYTKTSTRDAIYLAVSGRLYAMFVVSYTPNADVIEALKGFQREGISIVVNTHDFNITAQRIAKFYRFPKQMVAIVRDDDAVALKKATEYKSHAPSSLTHIGSLTSFAKGILGCHNLRSAARMSTTIEFIGLIIGIILAVGLTFMGSMLSIGVLSVLLFQSIWCFILFIMVSLHRY